MRPVVLVDVPEDNPAVAEETFGPVIVINTVRDVDDAVARANGTRFGLGASVFSKSRGAEIADRMRAGGVTVNSVLTFVGMSSVPFGGVGDSGFGRIHGPDGLKEFTYAKAVTRQRFKPPLNLTTFGRTPEQDTQFVSLLTALHGRANQLPKRPLRARRAARREDRPR